MKKTKKWLDSNTKYILILDLFMLLALAISIYAFAAPENVQGFTVHERTYSTVDLHWKKAANAKGYRIYRSRDGKNYNYIASTADSSFIDKGLVTGTTYYYTITSRNGFRASKLDKGMAQSVTPSLDKPELNVQTASGQMELTYTSVDGALGYEILRDGEVIDNVEDTKYVDAGAAGDTDYSYTVRAYRYKKEPVYSDASNAAKAILHSVQGFNIKTRDNDLVIEWKDSDYYKTYKLFNGDEQIAETEDSELSISDYELDKMYDLKLIGYAEDQSQSPANSKRFKVVEEEMTNEDARNEACAWALDIVNDNSFTYGTGKRAHNYGCYFCGTNVGPNMNKKGKSKVNGHSYAKTYCCNPFVTACYAHGAGDPNMLNACQHGRGVEFSVKSFTKYGNWKSIGKPKVSTLEKGDVIVWPSHVMIYIGDGKIAHAKTEGWGAGSITTDSAARYYKRAKFVMRYTGNGRGIKRVIRDVDELGNIIEEKTSADQA